MTNLFETVLKMSASAAIVVIALLVFRPLLKKLPGGLRSLLWVMVAVRLLCPVLIESKYSLMPESVAVAQKSPVEQTTHYPIAPPTQEQQVQPPQITPVTPTPDLPVTSTPVTEIDKPSPLAIGAKIWLVGTGLMLLYFAVSYLRLKRRVAPSIKAGDGVYICDDISSPFIMGLLSPRIYLPSELDGKYRDVIVAHERAHISRADHIQKLLGYIVLSLHWFNPFIWCAYWLFCKDIELSCDERVIKGKEGSYKKLYASALLYCCTQRRSLTPCAVAFGEVNAKQRITKVLKHKKASLYIIIAGLAIGAVIAVLLLTNPKPPVPSESGDDTSITDQSTPPESDEESTDTSVDTSIEISADVSVDTSTDTSVEISADVSVDTSTDTSTPEEGTETKPVTTPTEHLSLQSTHSTPEGVYPEDDCVRYGVNDRVPVYVQVYDKERAIVAPPTSYYIRTADLKVWLCDSKGNRIDYVGTNSNGLAKFEVYEGSYTIHFAGTDVYAPYTSAVFEAKHPLIPFYGSPTRLYVATYKKASFSPCTITVLDADTGKPVRNVHVTRYKYKDSGFYTDANGKVTVPPLIEYNGTAEEYCGLSFTCQGYTSQTVEAGVRESSITVRLSKLKEFPYTVRILDADTGEGVEGVWLILSDYADTSKVYTAVSGKDGMVSGMKNSNQLALYPQINLYYSAEGIPYEQRTEKGTGLYARLSIVLTEGSNEYTVYLKTDKENQTVTLFG